MKAIPTTLKIFHEDGVTIEIRNFPSIRKAKNFRNKFYKTTKTELW